MMTISLYSYQSKNCRGWGNKKEVFASPGVVGLSHAL